MVRALSRACLRLSEILLSMIHMVGGVPCFENMVCICCHASVITVAVLFLIGIP